jgi:predicted GTPase
MPTLAEYFKANRYSGKYSIGDRVIGKWNKIPFVGTVGKDTLINEIEGQRISIHLDLPIKYKDVVYNVIFVKHKDIRLFT